MSATPDGFPKEAPKITAYAATVNSAKATSPANSGRRPNLWHSVFRSLDDFHWLRTAERTAAVLKHNRLHQFARENVRYENHASLVTSHEDSAVRHLLNSKS